MLFYFQCSSWHSSDTKAGRTTLGHYEDRVLFQLVVDLNLCSQEGK